MVTRAGWRETVLKLSSIECANRTGRLAFHASAAAKGEFELYKTSHNFDGTFHNPQWLG